MRPPVRSLIGPRGLCSCCELFLALRRRFGGAGGPKFALRSRTPGGPRWARTTEPTARRALAAEPAPGWSWPAEATGPRRRAIFPSPCLAHGQIASLEGLLVELLDDPFGHFSVDEFHERKPARTAGFTIHGHRYVGRLGHPGEMCAQVGFGCAVGEIPDEETDGQCFLVTFDAGVELLQILSQNCAHASPDPPIWIGRRNCGWASGARNSVSTAAAGTERGVSSKPTAVAARPMTSSGR